MGDVDPEGFRVLWVSELVVKSRVKNNTALGDNIVGLSGTVGDRRGGGGLHSPRS